MSILPAISRRSILAARHGFFASRGIFTKPYYVTTPIFYVNADPHIGHLHSMVLADVMARYQTMRRGQDSILSTGTDEHGLKIQRVAAARNEEPLALCNMVSERFKELATAANIKYTRFIRTTDADHMEAARTLWNTLVAKGHIYKGHHSGWYAISDEAYYTDKQVEDSIDPVSGEKYKASIETGQRVEWTEEENYMFRLSAFRNELLDWLRASETSVLPAPIRHDLMRQLSENDLADLSISRPRSRLTWGIPVPNDTDHTIYVWLDALVNYLTVVGYPWQGKATTDSSGWPADVQIVGKDIVRFHAVYWPALLMACDIAPPKTILAHAHWTMGSFKMSKSRGNVADPFEAIRLVGTDAVRYYLMRTGGSLPSDADYSGERLLETYRKDLAGQLGNLLQRSTSDALLSRLQSPDLPFKLPEEQYLDATMIDALTSLPDIVNKHMEEFRPNLALIAIFDCVAQANRMLQAIEPWRATCKRENARAAIFVCLETLRFAAFTLEPFMPTTARALQSRLRCEGTALEVGAGADQARVIGAGISVLFPKLTLPGRA